MPIVYHQIHSSPLINRNHGGVHNAIAIARHPVKEFTDCLVDSLFRGLFLCLYSDKSVNQDTLIRP